LLYFWYLFCVDRFRNLSSVEFFGVSPDTLARSLRISGLVQSLANMFLDLFAVGTSDGADFLATVFGAVGAAEGVGAG
jgi:hypothetical protein